MSSFNPKFIVLQLHAAKGSNVTREQMQCCVATMKIEQISPGGYGDDEHTEEITLVKMDSGKTLTVEGNWVRIANAAGLLIN